MSNYQAISFAAHAALRWRPHSNFSFAAQDTVVALSVQEATKAALHLPLAFVPVGDGAAFVAVLGLFANRNLLVDGDGRWRAAYVPAMYRSYPFRLGSLSGSEQPVVCVDMESGLLTDAQDAEPFFAPDGQPSPALAEMMRLLQAVAQDQPRATRICAQLKAAQLLEPWPITLKTDQGEQSVPGLLRINEARLQAVEASVLKELQSSGALVVAYCQLLSMQHFPLLGVLARMQQGEDAKVHGLPTNSKGELDLEFLHQGGTLNFGNL